MGWRRVEGGSEGRGGGGVLMDRGEGVRGTQCYLVHLSIIENSIFCHTIYELRNKQRLLLVPNMRGLRRQKTTNIDPSVEQHRPT